jgi:hypothetical protein
VVASQYCCCYYIVDTPVRECPGSLRQWQTVATGQLQHPSFCWGQLAAAMAEQFQFSTVMDSKLCDFRICLFSNVQFLINRYVYLAYIENLEIVSFFSLHLLSPLFCSVPLKKILY